MSGRTRRPLKNGVLAGAVVVFAMAMALLVAAFAPVRPALAATAMLDPDQTGSISVTLHSTDGKAAGGELSLYKVASAVADDTGWHFVWDGAYESMGDDLASKTGALTASYASSLAQRLAPIAQNRTADQVLRTNADGIVNFSNLGVGMYLVSETAGDAGYTTISPFVVTVPVEDATTGSLVYNVQATPKAGAVEKTATPSNPTPANPVTPTASNGQLPKTGQDWLPILPIAACGVALVLVGGILLGRDRERAGLRG